MSKALAKLSDTELAKLFADEKKSEEAFKEFYSRYSRAVYAYCLKVLRNRDDAGDTFQEIFTTFFNVVKDGKILEKPMHYLMMVARTRCLNFIRDSKVARRQDMLAFDEGIMVAHNSGNDMLERYEKKEILDKALALLPDAYRDIFVMRMYNGLEYKDIAEISGETEINVRNKVYRARQKMKELVALYMK